MVPRFAGKQGAWRVRARGPARGAGEGEGGSEGRQCFFPQFQPSPSRKKLKQGQPKLAQIVLVDGTRTPYILPYVALHAYLEAFTF